MPDSLKTLAAPALLSEAHDCSAFNCGEPILDEWLQKRALTNIHAGASRTYVVCEKDSRKVISYYALCMGQIVSHNVTGSMRRNMPLHIPSVILGRLAIDSAWQGKGLGTLLLGDVVQRSLKASQEVSARLIIVHAISPTAESFYLHHGFTKLPVETPTLALDLMKLPKIHK